MPPKENSEMACGECIHFWACSMQCGGPTKQDNAIHCECYETIKSSMAYYVGTLDGAKVKIPNRLRELAEADKDGRCVVLPCKVDDVLYAAESAPVIPLHVMEVAIYLALEGEDGGDYERISNIGKTVFLTHEEAERAMEGRKDG